MKEGVRCYQDETTKEYRLELWYNDIMEQRKIISEEQYRWIIAESTQFLDKTTEDETH